MPKGRPRAAAAVAPGRRAPQGPQVRFPQKLILTQWVLSLFGVKEFKELAAPLTRQSLEGLDENNIHRFHHALTAQFVDRPELPPQLLLDYDQNIVRLTQKLNEGRLRCGQEPIVWKYFQYLSLLFTEIYLDRYFTDPQALLARLDTQVSAYNADKKPADQISGFNKEEEAWPQLNKLAFWSATGSGKTLLMHGNILQYQQYLVNKGRRGELNRIILLTPNEGLSQQHLREFTAAGIDAELFNKNGWTFFSQHWVQILDIHKLKDEMGDKTVAVDAFEGNNLVLVDEGHRGASAGEDGAWMRYRNALCEKGFSFEYSATFGQAVKGDKNTLTDLYAKSILFDYSYRYFYGDGFGKEYQILNLDEGTERNHRDLYLVACLLAFFQQQRLYREQTSAFRTFNIEKPLWIFVGGSVTKTLAKDDATDIIEILLFLARYLADEKASIARIDRVLSQGLVTADGKNLFANQFPYLNMAGLSPKQIFDDTLATLFNAPGGGSFHVENLKGATGEIALRVGENAPFGVINVGDDAKLCKLSDEHRELDVTESQFAGSLFHEINQPASTVNLLIGAKKFTEGWNSWRVSTMGLMNVGQSEGAQIIQLFGRGVRLKGYKQCLKRSNRAELPDGVTPHKHIEILERLSIFGIRANYMAQFRDFLEEEVGQDKKTVEFKLPVIKHLPSSLPLKTIRLKKTINGVTTEFGDAFRRLAPIPTLAKPDVAADELTAHLQKNKVELDWYPKIHAMKSRGVVGGDEDASKNATFLTREHVAFMDIDRLYFELERFKAERGWYNLNLTREGIRELLGEYNWYTLLIPAEEMAFTAFEKVRLWEEIALSLLKKYTDHYYKFRKAAWEFKHLEYRDLEADDPNFLGVKEEPHDSYYRITVEEDQHELVAQLEALKALIEQEKLKSPWEFRGLKAASFGPHLYEPLLFLDRTGVQISPVPLNKGEWQFVQDLKAFYEKAGEFFANKQLYLLRNQSKGRGVGFFEAGNFHPDFMLWLVAGGQQEIIFVDPKGIWNLGQNDPKVRFHETIKVIEQRLADPNVRLESFIVTPTRSSDIELHWSTTKLELQKKHILFQEDKQAYVRTLLEKTVADEK